MTEFAPSTSHLLQSDILDQLFVARFADQNSMSARNVNLLYNWLTRLEARVEQTEVWQIVMQSPVDVCRILIVDDDWFVEIAR